MADYLVAVGPRQRHEEAMQQDADSSAAPGLPVGLATLLDTATGDFLSHFSAASIVAVATRA